ncbi:hypothetical protein D9M71_568230 [compost metagenome]
MANWLALGFIGGEQVGSAPAQANGGEFPAEVGGVVHRGVVSLARSRCEQVGGIARNENPACAIVFRHQGESGRPFGDADDLVREIAAGRQRNGFMGVLQ